MTDEAQRMMNETALIIAENRLVRTMNTELRDKQLRDAEKILSLENEIALVQPSAQSLRDAEKVQKLKTELDIVRQFNETSNSLLEITKKKLRKSEKSNKELEKSNHHVEEKIKKLQNDLKKYVDKETSEKKVVEMHLKRLEEAEKVKTDLGELQEIGDLKGLEKLSMLDPAVR
jgi:CO dehydrogenase nickel-insertion accessory protein CooC1